MIKRKSKPKVVYGFQLLIKVTDTKSGNKEVGLLKCKSMMQWMEIQMEVILKVIYIVTI